MPVRSISASSGYKLGFHEGADRVHHHPLFVGERSPKFKRRQICLCIFLAESPQAFLLLQPKEANGAF